RQLAERPLGVVNDNHGQRIRSCIVAIHQGGSRAAGGGGIEKGVAVEALAAQRDEQLAAADRATVARYAGEAQVGAADAAAEHVRRFGQAYHRAPRSASAARATA